jgi:hypothetical protein
MFIIATLEMKMSTLSFFQTMGLCSYSFALFNEKTRTGLAKDDKLLIQQIPL